MRAIDAVAGPALLLMNQSPLKLSSKERYDFPLRKVAGILLSSEESDHLLLSEKIVIIGAKYEQQQERRFIRRCAERA